MAARPRIAILGAAGGVALLLMTWYVTFHVGPVERADQSIFHSFAVLGERPHVNSVAEIITRPFGAKLYVLLAAIPMLAAIARRRFWVALSVGGILLGANATTEVLKPLLAHPRAAGLLGGFPPLDAASWPSGHATAAMSFALCCVLAAPARFRPFVAAIGAVLAALISVSFLTLEFHYPSDIIAGFLVAGIWALLGIAFILYCAGRASQPKGLPCTP